MIKIVVDASIHGVYSTRLRVMFYTNSKQSPENFSVSRHCGQKGGVV